MTAAAVTVAPAKPEQAITDHDLIEVCQKLLSASSAEGLTSTERRQADRAFAKLLTKYDKWLWKQVNSIPSLDEQDAYSAAVEGFQTAIAKFDRSRGYALTSKAYHCVRGALSELLRKEKGQVNKAKRAAANWTEGYDNEFDDPYKQEQLHQSIQRLNQATASFSETTQQILSKRSQGMKFPAIGAELDKSADAVRMAYNRAIVALRSLLEKQPEPDLIEQTGLSCSDGLVTDTIVARTSPLPEPNQVPLPDAAIPPLAPKALEPIVQADQDSTPPQSLAGEAQQATGAKSPHLGLTRTAMAILVTNGSISKPSRTAAELHQPRVPHLPCPSKGLLPLVHDLLQRSVAHWVRTFTLQTTLIQQNRPPLIQQGSGQFNSDVRFLSLTAISNKNVTGKIHANVSRIALNSRPDAQTEAVSTRSLPEVSNTGIYCLDHSNLHRAISHFNGGMASVRFLWRQWRCRGPTPAALEPCSSPVAGKAAIWLRGFARLGVSHDARTRPSAVF